MKLQKLNSSPWRGRFGSFYKLLSRHNTKKYLLILATDEKILPLTARILTKNLKKKKSALWLQSDPIPFIIKNFYGSSLREEGLTYLTCSRRPLLIQSWLHLPLLLIPIPTRKPESRPQWAAVVLQMSPQSLGPSHSCSLCLERPSSTFSAKKRLPLKTSLSSSYTLYKHTHKPRR